MKKMPTLFERDWSGDKSRVVNKVNPKAQWVIDGEGVATRKLEGTSCLIDDGVLFKRRELRKEGTPPDGFVLADHDEETGKTVGWMKVERDAEDCWHREAFDQMSPKLDGTYELVGPKIQGNPERYENHRLIGHFSPAVALPDTPPRTFDGLQEWLKGKDIEGIVWHHSDGRMAKIKLRDFGFKRLNSGKQANE